MNGLAEGRRYALRANVVGKVTALGDWSIVVMPLGVALELVDQSCLGVALILMCEVVHDVPEVPCAEGDDAVLVLPAERLLDEFRVPQSQQAKCWFVRPSASAAVLTSPRRHDGATANTAYDFPSLVKRPRGLPGARRGAMAKRHHHRTGRITADRIRPLDGHPHGRRRRITKRCSPFARSAVSQVGHDREGRINAGR